MATVLVIQCAYKYFDVCAKVLSLPLKFLAYNFVYLSNPPIKQLISCYISNICYMIVFFL